MSIKDVDTFKKVVIENNYEVNDEAGEGLINYGYNIVKDIKENCKFYKIITTKISKDDFSCYSCASSTYKGKIGFMIREKTGFIKHFPEE